MSTPRRLLCDEMLRRLGRWLRAAGHDTEIAEEGTPDAALIKQAQAEGRTLVTRDLELAGRARDRGFLLRGGDLNADARQLRDGLGIDWLAAPFTRCVVDNTPLVPAPPEVIAAMPEDSRVRGGPFNVCPACGRGYWPGSHVRRMQSRLEEWAQG